MLLEIPGGQTDVIGKVTWPSFPWCSDFLVSHQDTL